MVRPICAVQRIEKGEYRNAEKKLMEIFAGPVSMSTTTSDPPSTALSASPVPTLYLSTVSAVLGKLSLFGSSSLSSSIGSAVDPLSSSDRLSWQSSSRGKLVSPRCFLVPTITTVEWESVVWCRSSCSRAHSVLHLGLVSLTSVVECLSPVLPVSIAHPLHVLNLQSRGFTSPRYSP